MRNRCGTDSVQFRKQSELDYLPSLLESPRDYFTCTGPCCPVVSLVNANIHDCKFFRASTPLLTPCFQPTCSSIILNWKSRSLSRSSSNSFSSSAEVPPPPPVNMFSIAVAPLSLFLGTARDEDQNAVFWLVQKCQARVSAAVRLGECRNPREEGCAAASGSTLQRYASPDRKHFTPYIGGLRLSPTTYQTNLGGTSHNSKARRADETRPMKALRLKRACKNIGDT